MKRFALAISMIACFDLIHASEKPEKMPASSEMLTGNPELDAKFGTMFYLQGRRMTGIEEQAKKQTADLTARVDALEKKIAQNKFSPLKRACKTSRVFAFGVACGVAAMNTYQKDSEYYQGLLQNAHLKLVQSLSERFGRVVTLQAASRADGKVEEVEEVKKSSELDAANTRAQGLNANIEAVIGTP